jgi:hypothetical protein
MLQRTATKKASRPKDSNCIFQLGYFNSFRGAFFERECERAQGLS